MDAVIIANPKTDLYNPNIVRSSVGCLFTNQIAIGLFNGTTIIYDLDTLKVEATLKSESSQRILCLAWNP